MCLLTLCTVRSNACLATQPFVWQARCWDKCLIVSWDFVPFVAVVWLSQRRPGRLYDSSDNGCVDLSVICLLIFLGHKCRRLWWKTFPRNILIGNIFNSTEIRTVGLHAVLAWVGTFLTVVSFSVFFFFMESVTSQSFSPDLCLEEDLNHAMANCFEALIGEFFQNPKINMNILFTAIQIFLMILLGRIWLSTKTFNLWRPFPLFSLPVSLI